MTNKIVLAFALALSLCFVACDKKEKELSLPEQYSAVKSAVTDDNNNLCEYDIADPGYIKITPRSVTTIILR